MLLRLLLLLTFIPSFIFSTYNDGTRNGNLSLIHLESASGSVIDGCVNAITGEYFRSTSDIAVMGVEPLVLERYLSDKLYFCHAEHSWQNFGFNFASQINPLMDLYVIDSNGGKFTLEFSHKSGHDHNFALRHDHVKFGVTNYSNDRIGRKNHLRYIKATTDKKRKNVTLKYANGGRKYYKKIKIDGNDSLLLASETLPNGCFHEFGYTDRYGLSQVTLKGNNGDVLGSLTFKYPGKKELKTNPYFDVHASNGQSVRYHLRKDKKNVHFDITRVEMNHAPHEDITVIHDEYGKKMLRAARPENRFKEAHLFHYGEQSTRNGKVKIKYNRSNPGNAENWIGKVRRLKAPVGHDATPIITHEFCYWTPLFHDIGTNIIHSGKGSTTVYDAHSHKTCYHWNDSFQLEKIEKFKGTRDHSLYSIEHYRYDNAGQLTLRYFEVANEGILFCRQYFYNEHGDVIEDKLWGNLTGTCSNNYVHMGPHGPVNNGIDTYSIKYQYSNDRFHNVIHETDGVYETSYQYLSGTDKLTVKYTGPVGKIENREFYDYNGRGELVALTCDDGSSTDRHNLENVSLRSIERRQYDNNLPVVVEKFFYDFDNEIEKLDSRKCFVNSRTGKPLQESIFDSDGTLRYTLHHSYDAHDNLISTVDPTGVVTTFTYDQNDNLISQTREGITKHCTYDFVNRLIKEEIVTDGQSKVQSYRYNYLSEKVASVDTWGNETRIEYDDFSRPVVEISPTYLTDRNEPFTPVMRKSYDALGNVVTSTSPSNYTVYSKYNIRGQLLESRDEEGILLKCEYSTNGRLVKQTERNGVQTAYSYDYAGRELTRTTYDAKGFYAKSIRTEYQGALKVEEEDEAGVSIFYSYNFRGQCISQERLGLTIFYDYDSCGRVIAERKCDSFKTCCYDNLDRIIEQSDDGIITNRSYDAHGRIVVEQIGDSITTTRYNGFGEPISITDGEGRATHIEYQDNYLNALGQPVRVLKTTYCNGTVAEIEHNAHGQPYHDLWRSNSGQILKDDYYYYHTSGQLSLTVSTVIAKNETLAERTVRMMYDTQGRLIELRDGDGTPEQKTTTYFYNSLGQKTAEKQPNGNELHMTYDSLGRMDSISSNDRTIDYRYHYDNRDNILRVDDRVQNTICERSYDLSNRLLEEKLANGLTVHYDYDVAGRLTTLTLPDSTTARYTYTGKFIHTVSDGDFTHTYEQRNSSGRAICETTIYGNEKLTSYSPIGQKLSIQNADFKDAIIDRDVSGNPLLRMLQNMERHYRWDDLHQIQKENEHDYTHDSQYNRRAKDGNNYSINALNQVTHDGNNPYIHDKNGNIIEARGYRFEYDALNRLTTVHTPTDLVHYTYDFQNRRMSSSSEGGTLFIYAGMNEVGSLSSTKRCVRLLGEGDGAERSAGVLFKINDDTYEPVYDIVGNVVALRNETGTVETYDYDLFGISDNKTPLSPWGFSSKRLDLETGFLFFGHRYYDPSLGRWITADPKGYAAGPNLYAYIKNNPAKYLDEYGLKAERESRYAGIKKSISIGKCRDRLVNLTNMFRDTAKPSDTKGFTNAAESDTVVIETDPDGEVLYSLGLDKEPANYFISFGNGICNTLKDAGKSAGMISKHFGGYNVYILHAPTDNLFTDVMHAGLEMMGIYDKHCKNIERQVRALHKKFPDKEHLGFMHSRGALTFHRALERLSLDFQRKTHVRTFGGAHFIPLGNFASVANYASTYDIVPHISNPISSITRFFQDQPHINFVEGQGIIGLDHAFSSPTYQEIAKMESYKFKMQYGE